jgi:hypothetical protein
VSRSKLIIEAACILLLGSAGVCLSFLLRSGPVTLATIGPAFLVPSISTVLFLCVSMAVPDLYAVGSMRFPLTFTLPLVYVAMLLLTTMLITRVGVSIARIQDNLLPMNIWASAPLLLWTYLTGVLFLSAVGKLGGKTAER